jgi:hypothetical protein
MVVRRLGTEYAFNLCLYPPPLHQPNGPINNCIDHDITRVTCYLYPATHLIRSRVLPSSPFIVNQAKDVSILIAPPPGARLGPRGCRTSPTGYYSTK